MSRHIVACLAVALLGACYKIDIQQGNVIDAERIERLRPGMSKLQVETLLGRPLLIDPFNADRWDYIYDFFPSANESRAERRRLKLTFDGALLSAIDADLAVEDEAETASAPTADDPN